MRETIYAHLSKLYAQVIALVAVALAFLGAVYPEQLREVLGERLTVETILSAIAIFLVFLALYFYLLWVMKPTSELQEKAEKPAKEQVHEPYLARQNKTKPDTSLKSVRNRIIVQKGGVPHSGTKRLDNKQKAEREAFHKSVDLEILDQVTQNRMSVWGRYGDGARQILRRPERLRFDHRNDCVSVQGDAVRPMVFEDVMFDGDEVQAVWPTKD